MSRTRRDGPPKLDQRFGCAEWPAVIFMLTTRLAHSKRTTQPKRASKRAWLYASWPALGIRHQMLM
jgi:hypothetical protein